uniref:50S ribosomal protein L20 n=1 Tax=Zeugodacus cucurbitae TaxID=28588 RepID=A0A0A1WCP2_ZEUCU
MNRLEMTQKLVVIIFICLLSAEHYFCARNPREPRSAESAESFETERPEDNSVENSLISSATRAQFEREALNETKLFLNNLFRSQIDYFSKVKGFLPATVKRVSDINTYIERLEKAILADSVQEKDKMWRDTFVEFSESAFLLNKEKDTGVSNGRYIEILNEAGLEETTKKFLSDVTVYFWKMAKASGKVVESTIDEQIEKWKKE